MVTDGLLVGLRVFGLMENSGFVREFVLAFWEGVMSLSQSYWIWLCG